MKNKKQKREVKYVSQIKGMKGVRNHDPEEDGGRLVQCSVCGKPGLVHEDDANLEMVCEKCDGEKQNGKHV